MNLHPVQCRKKLKSLGHPRLSFLTLHLSSHRSLPKNVQLSFQVFTLITVIRYSMSPTPSAKGWGQYYGPYFEKGGTRKKFFF